MGEKYKKPSITTDIFIFNDNKEFVLIKRRNEPFKDCWALPGGFIDYGETVENAAVREAFEETSIPVKLEKLVNVYSDPQRDSRGHTITIAYTAIGDLSKAKANDDAKDLMIVRAEDIENMDLAFDHRQIIEDSLKLI